MNEEWQQRKNGFEESRAGCRDIRGCCVGSDRKLAVGTGGQVRVKMPPRFLNQNVSRRGQKNQSRQSRWVLSYRTEYLSLKFGEKSGLAYSGGYQSLGSS